jgi:hypothetical protein
VVVHMVATGVLTRGMNQILRKRILKLMQEHSAEGAVLDMTDVVFAIHDRQLRLVVDRTKDDGLAAKGPVAFVVNREDYDVTDAYCAHMANAGLARGAFVSLGSAERWVGRRLALGAYPVLPASAPRSIEEFAPVQQDLESQWHERWRQALEG